MMSVEAVDHSRDASLSAMHISSRDVTHVTTHGDTSTALRALTDEMRQRDEERRAEFHSRNDGMRELMIQMHQSTDTSLDEIKSRVTTVWEQLQLVSRVLPQQMEATIGCVQLAMQEAVRATQQAAA